MELLWINCCISGKENSRTYKLSKEFLEKYKSEENLEVVEIDLSLQKLQPLKKEDIEKRDRLLKSGSLNDPIFDFADRFRRANYIVISAPYWDLSFPSLLKVFLNIFAYVVLHLPMTKTVWKRVFVGAKN